MMNSRRSQRNGSGISSKGLLDDDDTDSTSSSLSSVPVLSRNNRSSRSTNSHSNRTTTTEPPTSTLEVKKKPYQQQQDQQPQGCKKLVSFQHPKVNKLYRNTMTCREECQEQWYSAKDYAQFKAEAKLIAAEIAKREQQRAASASSCFLSSSSSSSLTSFSYQSILQHTLQACLTHTFNMSSSGHDNKDTVIVCGKHSSSTILTKTEEQHLRQWLNAATMRLGLEGMTIREIGRDRSHRRKHIQKVVLQAQADILAVKRKVQPQQRGTETVPSNNSNNNNSSPPSRSNWLSESQAWHLQKVSQAVSQPSRLLAHELARASAAPS
jgi:hypothetical protein